MACYTPYLETAELGLHEMDFFCKDIISCEHNRASTSLINSECFIIACSPKAGSYYGESQRFWGAGLWVVVLSQNDVQSASLAAY